MIVQHPDSYNSPTHFLTIYKVPGLDDIPIIGPVFFEGTLFLYFAYAAVTALFHTKLCCECGPW